MLTKVPGGSEYMFRAGFYARKHGAEKTKQDGPVGHFCESVYPIYFEPIQDEEFSLLEIGVYEGNSLRMWRDYFPNAHIYGIDIETKYQVIDENRIQTFLGDQSSRPFLKFVVGQTGPLDIVIDDGSHVSKHQIATFEFLFPRLAPGGLYIIEDLQLSYSSKWGAREGSAGGREVEGTIVEYLKCKTDDCIIGGELTDVEYIHFYRSIVVVRKKES